MSMVIWLLFESLDDRFEELNIFLVSRAEDAFSSYVCMR